MPATGMTQKNHIFQAHMTLVPSILIYFWPELTDSVPDISDFFSLTSTPLELED